MEYHICKIAAETLGETNLYSHLFVRSPMEIDFDPTYQLTHSPYVLFEALKDAIGRGARRLPPPKDSFEPLVTRPVISVTSKIFTVLRALRQADHLHVSELFHPESGRSGLVATFLAMLELMKSGKIWLEEETVFLRTNQPTPSM